VILDKEISLLLEEYKAENIISVLQVFQLDYLFV